MTLVSINNIEFSIGTKNLFSDVDLTIVSNSRIGLVGANGSGKTTFLRLITGQLEPHRGSIHYRNGLKLAFVEQFLPPELKDKTVFDAVAGVTEGYIDRNSSAYLVEILLERMGIDRSKWGQKLESLSGG